MYELSAAESDCVSELEIDEWLAGELTPAEEQRCQDHVERCAACRDRKLAAEQASAAFYSQAPSFEALRAQVPKGPARVTVRAGRALRSWRSVAMPLAAACAALLVFLVSRPGSELDAPGETRSKGGPRLGYYVKRGDAIVRGDSGASLRAGDSLRFVYSSQRAAYVAVFSTDARGVSAYYPSAGRAVLLPPGADTALDFSVELDDAPGAERVTALFCREEFTVESARSALASTSLTQRELSGAPLPAPLTACQRAELELNKQ